MDNCCKDKACEIDVLRREQSRTLWILLGINATMFLAEAVAGLLAGSVALLADSMDMLGDALVYGFSLFVVARSARWRAGAALLKGGIMMLFGLGVLVQAGYKMVWGGLPDAAWMGATGIVALGANALCLVLLTRHRSDDINMRSTWICSRNDIVANVGVIAAAAGVFVTGSMWPDLLISLLITAVFVQSAAKVLREAFRELGGVPGIIGRTSLRIDPHCPIHVCPPGACICPPS